MEVTNETLTALNRFRNEMIVHIDDFTERLYEDIPEAIISEILTEISNLKIELMADKINKDNVKDTCIEIATMVFLYCQKLNKDGKDE